jgi:hypothetical protein
VSQTVCFLKGYDVDTVSLCCIFWKSFHIFLHDVDVEMLHKLRDEEYLLESIHKLVHLITLQIPYI